MVKITKARFHDSFKIYIAKYSDFMRLGWSHMSVARLGLEPRLTGPEPVVLPLDDLAI